MEKVIASFEIKYLQILDENGNCDEKNKPNVSNLMQYYRIATGKNIDEIENAIFVDTSAIIDGRIFDVINIGVFTGSFVILDKILLELKHIADSNDLVKRLRGRKGLDLLEKLKKGGKNKVII